MTSSVLVQPGRFGRRTLLIPALAALFTLFAHSPAAAQWMTNGFSGFSGYFGESVSFPTPEIGFAGIWNPTQSGLMTTTNGGDTWNAAKIGGQQLRVVHFATPQIGVIAGANYDCNCGFMASTTNGGVSWNAVTIDFVGAIETVAFPTPQVGYLAGDSGFVYRTTNSGETWERSDVGSTTLAITSLAFPSANTGYAVAAPERFMRHTLLYKTTDGGVTWEQLHDFTGTRILTDATFMNDNTGILVGSENGAEAIFKTTDGGTTWRTVYTAAPSENVLQAVDFYNAQIGYAVGEGGIILRTTNGGETWYEEISGIDITLKSVDATSEEVAFAVGYFGVALRRTGPSGLPTIDADEEVDFGTVSMGDSGKAVLGMVAGTTAGIRIDSIYFEDPQAAAKGFTIADGGAITYPIRIAQGVQVNLHLRFYPAAEGAAQTTLVIKTNDATTPEKRVTLRANATTTSSVSELPVSGVSALSVTSHPNPTSGIAQLSLALPTSEHVTVTLFDMTGTRIATLYDGMLERGRVTLPLDLTALPSGVYRCQVGTAAGSTGTIVTVTR